MSTAKMDWDQVALNGGPPCFFVEPDTPNAYCGRAQRWQGHGVLHEFVSLEQVTVAAFTAGMEEAVNLCDAARKAFGVQSFTADPYQCGVIDGVEECKTKIAAAIAIRAKAAEKERSDD